VSYPTRRAAIASLREFAPWLREMHVIVRYWSEVYGAHRYTRVLRSVKSRSGK
jgi:cellulose synthase/poly-beta-1,6-N-acetylglucosamine synthase-like glycosyltransferase